MYLVFALALVLTVLKFSRKRLSKTLVKICICLYILELSLQEHTSLNKIQISFDSGF